MRKRILTTAIAAAIGVTSYTANAISLGAINQKSRLNQNYYATIDLRSIRNTQVYKVKAKLAPKESFDNADLERFYHLTKLKFKSQIINGKPAIVITSKEPIRQPYLNFLVEANWPEGRMIKEYTVFLGPPTYNKPKPKPSTATLLASRNVNTGQSYQNQARFEGNSYTVQKNDTLWNIAEKVNTGNASTYQMMMGLFNTNPNAFVRSNINNLIAGSVLSVPDNQQVVAVSKRTARANFNTQIKTNPSPSRSSELEVASGVLSSTDINTVDLDSAGNELLKTKLMMMTERAESSTQEADNLRNEVGDLKSQLSDMQRLLDLKSQQMTELQEQASMSSNTTTDNMDDIANQTDQMDDMSSNMTNDSDSMDDVANQTDQMDDMSSNMTNDSDSMVDDSASLDEAATTFEDSNEDIVDTDMTASEMDDTEMTDMTVSEMDDTDTTDDMATSEMDNMDTTNNVEDEFSGETNLAVGDSTNETVNDNMDTLVSIDNEGSNMDDTNEDEGLLDHAFALPALGLGGLLAAGGAGWMLFGRRRKEEYDNDEESILLPIDPVSSMNESLLIDSSESSLDESSFLSEFNENDIDDLQNDTSEVDLLSETDVYIAYGRYDQAEELINQALENKPDELPLLFKQLEIYYASRKTGDFDATLAHLQSLDAENEDPNSWMRAMDMQTELSSIDTGYAGAAGTGAAATAAVATASDTLIDGVDSLMQNESSTDDISNFNDSLDLADGTSEEIELDLGDNIELDLGTDSEDSFDLGAIDTTIDKSDIENDLDKTYVLDTSPIENEVEQTLTIKANQSNDDAIDDLDQSLNSLESLESGANEFDLSLTDDVTDIELSEDDFPVSTLDELDSSLEQDLSQLSELNLDDLDLGEPEDDSVLSSIDLSDFGDDDNKKPESADVNLGSEVVDDDEIETKLDLANAYAEMGDADGAKSIIEEIMDEGNVSQKAKASAILKNLS